MTERGSDDDLVRVAQTAFFEREKSDPVGVAVSGGSDSMAVLHLFHAAGYRIEAATVDHGLRPEAADEARLVAAACALLGVRHETLAWRGHPDTGNLQDLARRARYALLAEWARRRGLTHVLIGHTIDDQAETFLMRLSRDAGVDGLSGMRQVWLQDGILFRRPMLQRSRADLRGWLERHGIGWIEDPSNTDARFERVRARKALVHLAPLGIDAEALAGTALRLSSARFSLKLAAAELAKRSARLSGGDVVIPRKELFGLGDEIGRRLIIAALHLLAGPGYPPREASLLRMEAAIYARRTTTLSGCRIATDEHEVRFGREYRAVSDHEAEVAGTWDSRWVLRGPGTVGLKVRALGPQGLISCPDWRATGLPRATLLASPAVWDGDRLVAAPLAGLANGWTAELAEGRNSLSQFLMSH